MLFVNDGHASSFKESVETSYLARNVRELRREGEEIESRPMSVIRLLVLVRSRLRVKTHDQEGSTVYTYSIIAGSPKSKEINRERRRKARGDRARRPPSRVVVRKRERGSEGYRVGPGRSEKGIP